MRIVISLGDSAFLQKSQPLKAHILRQSVRRAARALAEAALSHQVVILHNNGPQIGMLTLMHGSSDELNLSSADVIGAQSLGVIGLMLEQELRNQMPGQSICSLINLTVIDDNDPALMAPSLFSGPVYTRAQAQIVQEQNPGWTLVEDGRYFRRLIAVPEPKEVMELKVLKHMMATGDTTVICSSGGGLPVRRDREGKVHGVDAIINQDKTAALVADGIDADALLLLSATEALVDPAHNARAIKAVTPEKLASLNLGSRKLKPKIEAANGYVNSSDRFCVVGSLFDVMQILAGESGTHIASEVKDSIVYYQ